MEKNNKKKILFVCAENAGRSQMAEGLFNYYAKEKRIDWVAKSSGTFPADKVNPLAIETMAEKGIDLSSVKPKQFIPENINNYTKVISFGCLVKSAFSKEVQEKIEDWHMDDPKDQPLEKVRQIRDDLERKIVNLIDNLAI